MQPAKTGRVVRSIKAVTNIHHKYSALLYTELDLRLFINILTKKLAEPRIDEIPAQ
jgi:hypothetical protein